MSVIFTDMYWIRDTIQSCQHKRPSLRYIQAEPGHEQPNYPVPAILPKHTKLIDLGYVSALNGFDVDAVFDWYVRL